MSRRLALLLAFPLLLLLLAGGLYLFRLEAATTLLKQQLAARGVEEPELQVTELTLDRATIEAVRLGAGQELRIGRLGLTYDWRELSFGQLRDITIDDAVIKLDLTGDSPPLGSLQALIETLTPEDQERSGDSGEEDGEATGPPIPPISFSGGRIEARTPAGPITLDASGVFEVAEDDRMRVTAQVAGEGEPGRAEGQVEAELLDGWPVRLRADLALTDFVLPQVTAQDAKLAIDFSEEALAVDLDLATAEGRAILALFLQSETALLDVWPAFLSDTPLASLEGHAIAGQGAFALEDFTLPGTLSDANADLVFDLALRDGAVHLDLPDPARLSAKIAPAPVRQAGLPDGLLPAFSQPLSLRLAQKTASSAALILWNDGDGFQLQTNLDLHLDYGFGANIAAGLDGEIRLSHKGRLLAAAFPAAKLTAQDAMLAGVKLAQGSYAGSLNYAGNGDLQGAGRLQISGLEVQGYSFEHANYEGRFSYLGGELSASGQLTAQTPSLSTGGIELEDIALDFPVDLRGNLEAAQMSWSTPARLTLGGLGGLPLETPGGGLAVISERGEIRIDVANGLAFTHDLALTLDLPETEIAGFRVRSAPFSLRLDGGTGEDGSYALQAEGGSESMQLPDYEMQASGIDLDGKIDAEGSGFTLRIARLSDRRDPQILPPLAATLDGKPSENGLTLDIAASGASNRLKVNGTVSIDTAAGGGSASFKLTPLLFVPGALQPVDIAPLLEGLTRVQAELRSEGRLAWNRGGLTRSSAKISLSNASMTTGAGRVEGLTTSLTLSSLWPPRSEPSQELSADSYETGGVTFTDLSARYRVVEGEGDFPETLPLLLIEHAELRFGRGLFEVSEVLIDPLSDRQGATVDVEGLELKDLFDLADLENVTGEGAMSGSVPFSISDGNVVIQNGRLESTGPGVFNIRSAEAKAALSGAGDYVDLVLQALENFQYERLSIAVNKPAEGNSVLQLKVLGSNPDVLDGHPFDINLNLETDLGPLLEALTAGQRLSEELMQQIREQRKRQRESPE